MNQTFMMIAVSGDLAAGAMGDTATTILVDGEQARTICEYRALTDVLAMAADSAGAYSAEVMSEMRKRWHDLESVLREGPFTSKYHFRSVWAVAE